MNIGPVIISPSGTITTMVGTNLTLNCSVNVTLPVHLPPPNLEWFFGENNSTISALNVTVSNVTDSDNTSKSIHLFSTLFPTSQLAGLSTCRAGGNEGLAASTMVNYVNCKKIQ